MVNTAKLRGKFAERGVPLCFGAKWLDMSERTFYSKMKSGKFGADDAAILADYLEIHEPTELVDIFLHRQ